LPIHLNDFDRYVLGHAGGMTPLETLELIFKVLTLVGLFGIVAGAFRSFFEGEDWLLYVAIGLTGMSGAFWIIIKVLLQE
jgi:hypothetical protein